MVTCKFLYKRVRVPEHTFVNPIQGFGVMSRRKDTYRFYNVILPGGTSAGQGFLYPTELRQPEGTPEVGAQSIAACHFKSS